MGNIKQTRIKDNDVISASELGQYHFCSMSWYLHKCGYLPKSQQIDAGIKKHEELGRVMYHMQVYTKKSRIFAVVGYLLLLVTILFFFLFEVIL